MLSYTTSYYNPMFSNSHTSFHIIFLTLNNVTKPLFLGIYNSYIFIKINKTYKQIDYIQEGV